MTEPLTTVKVPKHLVHDELNPDIWDAQGRIHPEVRAALLKVACDFIRHLGVVPRDAIVDITLTGSMANYNWSATSDLDVHPLVDLLKVDENVELVNELLQEKRATWNDTRKVEVRGHPVEAYPQDAREPHHSTGVYSLLKGAWLVRPVRAHPVVDTRSALNKARIVAQAIEKAVNDPDCSSECLASLRDQVRRFRQCGLEKGGEFSTENLAFKALRNSGHLGMLQDATRLKRDDELSLR